MHMHILNLFRPIVAKNEAGNGTASEFRPEGVNHANCICV